MAKKSFGAGATKPGILNTDGGEKLKEMQAKIQYNFKYIPKEKIVSNPKNEMYTQDGIEALKESILINGLRHNLSVLYNPDNDTYRLVSGERRYHAITSMSDKEYNDLFPAGIPCKVEKSEITEIDEEIMLISANHDVRESSMEVKRWEVSRLKELYEAKKIKGEIKNINAEIAKYILNGAGADIELAKDGKEAVEAFYASKEYYYDLILMDVMMPVMNGYEATKQIRSLDRKDAKEVPIIAMTANAFTKDKQDAIEAGMNEHVAKPLDIKLLLRVISRYKDKISRFR